MIGDVTTGSEDFVPVRSLDELQELGPGTRVKVRIKREERGCQPEEEVVCFTGYHEGIPYPFDFLDAPGNPSCFTGFACDDWDIHFNGDGSMGIGSTPGYSIPRSECTPKHGPAYTRNREYLEKSRFLPVEATTSK